MDLFQIDNKNTQSRLNIKSLIWKVEHLPAKLGTRHLPSHYRAVAEDGRRRRLGSWRSGIISSDTASISAKSWRDGFISSASATSAAASAAAAAPAAA